MTSGHAANQKLNISYSTKSVTTKLKRAVTYDEENSPMMSHDPLTIWSREVTWKIESLLSSLLKCLWFSKMSMSHDSLTQKSRAVTWQMKNGIFFLGQSLWPPNLAGWWVIMRGTHPYCHMTLWSRSHMRSRDKPKAKYLLFCKFNDLQTWQSMIHDEENSPIMTLWSRDHVKSRDKLKT